MLKTNRTGLSVETLRRALADNLFHIQGKWPEIASRNDFYLALAFYGARSHDAALAQLLP